MLFSKQMNEALQSKVDKEKLKWDDTPYFEGLVKDLDMFAE